MKIAQACLLFALACLLAVPLQSSGQEVRVGNAEINGVQIHYRIYGQGPPLLLLHGFTHTGIVWEPFIPQLSDRNTLIVPDMRGHGLSANPSDEFSHQLAARDFLGLLDHLELPVVAGVGHSSGGRALLELALMAPERVSAMVLVGSGHRFTDEAQQSLAGASLAVNKQTYPTYMEIIESWHPGGEAQLERLTAQLRVLSRIDAEEVADDEELRNLTVPTLIAHGDRDEINPAQLALELYELLPLAELWMMPNVSHVAFVSNWVHPGDLACDGCALVTEQFPAVLHDFLDRSQ